MNNIDKILLKKHWNKSACKAYRPPQAPKITPEEVLQELKILRYKKKLNPEYNQSHYGYLCLDNKIITGEALINYLPSEKIKNIDGYFKMLDTKLKGKEYMLKIDNFHLTANQYTMQCQHFLKPILDIVGLPNILSIPGENVGLDISLFLGKYQKTYSGVHDDINHLFLFPILGEKHIRGWDDAYVMSQPELIRALEYDEFKSESQYFTIDINEFIYWPPSFWHIAEAKAGEVEPTIALSLGVYPDKNDIVKKSGYQ